MTLLRLPNLCVPSVSRIPSDVEIYIFTHSCWLSKAVVFENSTLGFWPKKSNHNPNNIPEPIALEEAISIQVEVVDNPVKHIIVKLINKKQVIMQKS